jgi:starch synthase
MKIVFVAAEAFPFAKVGGLGDVIGALPPVLAAKGHDVKVILPGHLSTWRFKTEKMPGIPSVKVTLGIDIIECPVRVWHNPDCPTHSVYLIDHEEFFGRRNVYTDEHGAVYPDNPERFILFQKAALNLVAASGWPVDILHCHDNQTALIPVYLKTTLAEEPQFRSVRSILTLHNIAYQGICALKYQELCGLPEELFRPTGALEWFGQFNPLKGGILFADAVTTVSPTHAREIMEDREIGAGMGDILATRKMAVRGILNGIDYNVWDPAGDRHLYANFSELDLSGKQINKVELIRELKIDPMLTIRPLIGVVSRLVEQKGIDLLIAGLEQILQKETGFILLGSGEERFQSALTDLAARFPERMIYDCGYNDPLAHRIIAASDIFLMPSRFEPCGITQMYALRYGTVPVVRRTGGLADTVKHWDGAEGNGFVFESYSPDSFLKAVFEALLAYKNPAEWNQILRHGMTADFSWDRSAVGYMELYQNVMEDR